MMPLTAIILIKARLLERLLVIIGSLKILIIKFLPKMVKPYWRKTNNCIYDNCILHGMFDNKERKMSINK